MTPFNLEAAADRLRQLIADARKLAEQAAQDNRAYMAASERGIAAGMQVALNMLQPEQADPPVVITDAECDAWLAEVWAQVPLDDNDLRQLDYPRASHRVAARHAIRRERELRAELEKARAGR